jgi:hypothetical protein
MDPVTMAVRIARVFAPAPAEPRLGDPAQSWLSDAAERERVAAYLRGAPLILATTALAQDQLDPQRGKAVGASYRTDGDWVWSDALTYYVRVHGLAPESELLERIRAHDYVCPSPDDAARDDALHTLLASFG